MLNLSGHDNFSCLPPIPSQVATPRKVFGKEAYGIRALVFMLNEVISVGVIYK